MFVLSGKDAAGAKERKDAQRTSRKIIPEEEKREDQKRRNRAFCEDTVISVRGGRR